MISGRCTYIKSKESSVSDKALPKYPQSEVGREIEWIASPCHLTISPDNLMLLVYIFFMVLVGESVNLEKDRRIGEGNKEIREVSLIKN